MHQKWKIIKNNSLQEHNYLSFALAGWKLKNSCQDDLRLFCSFLWVSVILFGQQWSGDLFGYPGILSSLTTPTVLKLKWCVFIMIRNPYSTILNDGYLEFRVCFESSIVFTETLQIAHKFYSETLQICYKNWNEKLVV